MSGTERNMHGLLALARARATARQRIDTMHAAGTLTDDRRTQAYAGTYSQHAARARDAGTRRALAQAGRAMQN